MRIELEHDLDQDDLAAVLASLARAEGVAEDVQDLLAKSLADKPLLPHERHLAQMVAGLDAAYERATGSLARHVDTWLQGGRLTRRVHDTALRIAASHAENDPDELRKALPGIGLTEEQIEELAGLVAAHFKPAIVGNEPTWNIPPGAWDRWQALGIVPEHMAVPQFSDAYLAGRLYQVLVDGDDYEQMLGLARALPKTRQLQLAADWAGEHAAAAVTKFGKKVADEVGAEALSLKQRTARALIQRYIDGSLKVAAFPQGAPTKDLTFAERQALETDSVAKDWRTLSRELYKTFKGTEKRRDWLRLAASETRMAYNAGRIDAFMERKVKQFYYLVRDSACPVCRKLYLKADGTPKVFNVAEVAAEIGRNGGTNAGRPRDEWVATALAHPWCRCVPTPLIPGVEPTPPVA